MGRSIKFNNDTYISNDALGEVIFEGSIIGQDVQLSKSSSNFTYLDIICGGWGGIKTIRIATSLNTFLLECAEADVQSANYGFVKSWVKYNIDNNYLRFVANGRLYKYENDTYWGQDKQSAITIYKIYGIN